MEKVYAGSPQDMRWRIPSASAPQTVVAKDKTESDKNIEAYKLLMDENTALKKVIESITEVNSSLLKEISKLKKSKNVKKDSLSGEKAQNL